MAFRAARKRELIIISRNKAGVGHTIFGALAEKGVNVIAFHGYTHGRDVVLTMVTEDNTKAKRALKRVGFHADSREVILVECANRPGVFDEVAQRLTDAGVDFEYAYATSTSKTKGSIVLSTTDNKKAIKALK